MKRYARASSSTLFLLELISSILIFAITCAVCVGLLARSRKLSRDAEALNLAVREVCSAAELVRGADLGDTASSESAATADAAENAGSGTLDTLMADLWPSAQRTGDGWLVYYDADGQPCTEEADADYTLQISLEQSGDFLLASLAFADAEGEAIYSLQVERYLPEGGAFDG